MNMYFYLWLLMSACVTVLLIVNNQQRNIIKKYGSMVNNLSDRAKTGIVPDSDGSQDEKIAELEKAIKSANELIESTEDLNKRYKGRLDEKEKENERLKKLAADFLPMKTLADYKEKVTLLTEQAEDMFELYIEDLRMERKNSMFSNFWDININIHANGLSERKKVEQ